MNVPVLRKLFEVRESLQNEINQINNILEQDIRDKVIIMIDKGLRFFNERRRELTIDDINFDTLFNIDYCKVNDLMSYMLISVDVDNGENWDSYMAEIPLPLDCFTKEGIESHLANLDYHREAWKSIDISNLIN